MTRPAISKSPLRKPQNPPPWKASKIVAIEAFHVPSQEPLQPDRILRLIDLICVLWSEHFATSTADSDKD